MLPLLLPRHWRSTYWQILPESSPVTLMLRSPLLGEIKVLRARVISIKARLEAAVWQDDCGPRQARRM